MIYIFSSVLFSLILSYLYLFLYMIQRYDYFVLTGLVVFFAGCIFTFYMSIASIVRATLCFAVLLVVKHLFIIGFSIMYSLRYMTTYAGSFAIGAIIHFIFHKLCRRTFY
jgi:hypothetical protein